MSADVDPTGRSGDPWSSEPTRSTTRPRSRTIRDGTYPCRRSRATLVYLAAVLDRVRDALTRHPGDDRLLYFAELAACHEDMHGEALHYTRQTLGYPAPALPQRAPPAIGADG